MLTGQSIAATAQEIVLVGQNYYVIIEQIHITAEDSIYLAYVNPKPMTDLYYDDLVKGEDNEIIYFKSQADALQGARIYLKYFNQ